MKRRRTLGRIQPVILVVCVGIAYGIAQHAVARMWEVRRDGSGDFETIQPAVDAAAPGDTVLIGPGRYDEWFIFDFGVLSETTYVGISTDDLTIRGVERETVIIGPETATYDPGKQEPNGIATDVGLDRLTVENLTIENVSSSVATVTQFFAMRDCTLRNGRSSVKLFDGSHHLVENSLIEGSINIGIFAAGCDTVEIVGCEVHAIESSGIVISNTTHGVIRGSYSSGISAIKYQLGADGAVFDTTTETTPIGNALALLQGNEVFVQNCNLKGGIWAIDARGSSVLRGSRNYVALGTVAAIAFSGSSATAEFHNNYIESGPASWGTVNTAGYVGAPVSIDLSANFWGDGIDADSLATLIWDHNDDPDNMATVIFEPMLSTNPLPAGASSLGTIKAGFNRPEER